SVFFLPSLYEGFGLPLLEAMACGAPVLGANNSSIPEIIQNRDALFNAEDPSAIAQSLERVLSDRDWANHLRTQGLERSREFSWEKAAICAWQALHAHACKSPGSNSDQQMAQTLKPLIEADPQRWHKMKRSWTRCAAFHLGYLRPYRIIWAGTRCDADRFRDWLGTHFDMNEDCPIWLWGDPPRSGDPAAKVFRLSQYIPCIGDMWFVELAYQARWQKVAKKVRSVAGRSFAVCGVADRPRFQADLFDFWLDFSGPQVVLDVISPS
ncbi:MAG: glycosyltransferase, partial [Acidobacteria bacterium]|nr:glycosyltransferase [Acidobacteriota bacterium]